MKTNMEVSIRSSSAVAQLGGRAIEMSAQMGYYRAYDVNTMEV